MKKLVLLALSAMIMVGCDYQNSDGSYSPSKLFQHETYVIDSCEYVNGFNRLAHKGNCKYCQQRMRKLMLEVRDSLLWQTE